MDKRGVAPGDAPITVPTPPIEPAKKTAAAESDRLLRLKENPPAPDRTSGAGGGKQNNKN